MGVTKELDVTEVTEHTSLVTCCEMDILREVTGTSLVVQWLRLHAPNAGAQGSIPGQKTRSHMLQLKILDAAKKTNYPMYHN